MEIDDIQDIADMAVERDTLRWEVTRLRAELERAVARVAELEDYNRELGRKYKKLSDELAAAPLRDGWLIMKDKGDVIKVGDKIWNFDFGQWEDASVDDIGTMFDGYVVIRRVSTPDPLRDADRQALGTIHDMALEEINSGCPDVDRLKDIFKLASDALSGDRK